MTFPAHVAACAVAALVAATANAQYTLNYSLSSYLSSSTFPFTSAVIGDVNAYGHVAFAINDPPSQRGVFLYTGGLPIKIIDDGTDYFLFGCPDINCHDHVVVRAQRLNGGGDDMLFYDGSATPVSPGSGNEGLRMSISCCRKPSTRSVCS